MNAVQAGADGEMCHTSTAIKMCCMCGIDLNGLPRIKTPHGKYVCEPCYAKAKVAKPAPASPVVPAAHSELGTGMSSAQQARNYCPPNILPRITCPHCWQTFNTENILWIAEHAELLGDSVLGPETPARFLPSRFTPEGDAIDARGMASHLLACPNCHLVIPRALVESEPLMVSIIGVPASGKSYFLTAMTWELRRLLPSRFSLLFNDADTVANRLLNEYEETLFLQNDSSTLVAIRKTELQGELYDQIHLGQQVVSLPRPFLFTLRPATGHPAAAQAERIGRVICLYDNAGEHFQPGMDSASSPVTRHLARSRVLMFLFDPTQDPRFRDKCREFSSDPQLMTSSRTQRQETVLTEAAMRVRHYTGLPPGKKYNRPLLVVVPKSDAWGRLLDVDISTEPFMSNVGELGTVDVARIEHVSACLRELLCRLTPEFVTAAEDFCQHVVYIPVSALGHPPEIQEGTGMLGVRPGEIKPSWVTAPVLYMFAKWSTGLIWAAGSRVVGAMSSPAIQKAIGLKLPGLSS